VSQLIEEMDKLIEKPLGEYRSDTEVDLVLRRRLTKKEYKVFFAELLGESDRSSLMEKLNLDEKRYGKLWENAKKKINSDRIKRELFLI